MAMEEGKLRRRLRDYSQRHFSDKHMEILLYEFFENLLLDLEDIAFGFIVVLIMIYYFYVKCQVIKCEDSKKIGGNKQSKCQCSCK